MCSPVHTCFLSTLPKQCQDDAATQAASDTALEKAGCYTDSARNDFADSETDPYGCSTASTFTDPAGLEVYHDCLAHNGETDIDDEEDFSELDGEMQTDTDVVASTYTINIEHSVLEATELN